MSSVAAQQPVAKPRMTSTQRWVLSLASVGSFMVILDVLVVTTALTTIQKDLNASLPSLEWTINAYSLAFAVLLLTGSALGDRFGRKRMFITGLVIFTLASAGAALAPNISVLIPARAIQGMGAALVMPLALTQISAAFPPQQRGRALGIFSGVTGLATFLGPFVGGAVAEGLAWQWIFWINIPIGVIAILLVLRRIEETSGPNNRIDIVGNVLAICASFGVVWGLIFANSAGWDSAEVIVSLIVGAILGIAFVMWENRTPAPMLPMRFFKLRAFSTANAGNFAVYASLYGQLFLLAQYFQVAQDNGPLAAGLRLMPWTATLMICAPIAGNLADRIGERVFMVSGLVLQAIGLAWLALIVTPTSPYSTLVFPLIVGGAGISAAMPVAQKSVVGAVKPQQIGQASGVISALRILAGVFGIAILTAVFAAQGGYSSPQEYTDGFAPALGVAAAIALAGALASLGMPAKRPQLPPQGPPPVAEKTHRVEAEPAN